MVGEVPFGGASDFDIKEKQVRDTPDLDHIPGSTPVSVHRIVTRALAKAPEDRYASADAMGQAVGEALAD